MSSVHVALFLPSLNGGGAEKVMVTLANAFASRGHRVDLVLASKQGPFIKVVSPSVRLVDLQAGRVIRALLPLARYLRQEQPVAMLSAMGHANVVALLARIISGQSTRVVISERGTVSGEFKIARGFVARSTFRLIPWLYPFANGITTVSHAAATDLAEFSRLSLDSIRTIYNPFDLDAIEKEARKPLDNAWFQLGAPPVILGIGRLNEAKDFHILIRAFSMLRQERALRLVILGEGELRGFLEDEVARHGISQDVAMPGFVDNPYAYLARSAVFVLSSRREGLPGALIEAMACGTPVVSTDCLSGPDEILEGGRWGKLVPVGDVHALAQAIKQVLDTSCEKLPDVRLRAQAFAQNQAVNAYLDLLGVTSSC